MQIQNFPVERFASLPTPLWEMPRLSKKLGGPRLLIKRDDLTGLAFGGNKTRKLEFIMADAKKKGSDVIITGAGLQSNWCTQTVAVAQRYEMKTILCSSGPEGGYKPEDYGGNMILHYILGADVRVFPVSFRELHEKIFVEVAEELRAKGYNPYVAKFAGSTPIGTLGYVDAMQELLNQATGQGIEIDYVLTASGTGGTQAGLLLAAEAMKTGIKIIGVAVRPDDNTKFITQLIRDTSELIDAPMDSKPEVTVFDEFVGEGYGAINKEVVDTIKLVAQTEGIFLDPVYTGKAMTGLINLTQNGYFTKKDTVVFLHTGGTPALFAYKDPIKSLMETRTPSWTKPPWGSNVIGSS